ncbi:MAG TPA: heavy-metal-associated domain-containing protein [Baekduia sp.]|uniref:heavy-metal-associated domain-containing protein n=1 Tax=Baekduia sp. TaxID=2600305 RepID=UPI002CDEA75F|nr:heavy-metal-associated domain-containing protein [Baekduia sp.]HMJ37760.1 heavy-metal-associated domain-containing protein [Baekduia sp.]
MTPTTHQYVVEGMTCEHCRASVSEEVAAIDGAQDVQVDLHSGGLTILGDVSDHAVRAAVAEAGYHVVS